MDGFVKHFQDIKEEKVEMEGAKDAYIRWLIGPNDNVPNFYLRMFRLLPGGHTPYHSHPYEHEVFVLDGTGSVVIEGKEHTLTKGNFSFIPPNANHQFLNKGDTDFVFLCIIPITKG